MKRIALLLSTLIMTAATVNAQLPTGQFLGPDLTPCPGGTGLGFSGNEVGFNPNWTYLWSTGSTASQIFFPYSTAGNYTVWCKVSLNGNSSTDTVHFTVYPDVAVPVITSTAFGPCVDQATLSTPSVSGHTYQWYKQDAIGAYILLPGQNGNALIVSQSGTYRIKVTNGGGCFAYNELAVSILGKPKQYLHDTAFCATNGPNFAIGDNLNTNCTYLWNQGNTGDDWVINPSQVGTTTYWVTITNANGCSTNDTITTTIHPSPNPLINSGEYTCGNDVILRDLVTAYDHIWKFGANIISTADSMVVNYPGTFTVKTTSQNGCSVTNTVYVLQSPSVNVNGFTATIQNVTKPREFYFQAVGASNVNTYEWNFGDGFTSNQSNPTHEYTNSDTSAIVTLTVSNSNFDGDCKIKVFSMRITTDTDTVPPPTSITDIENEAGMNIYPNPVVNDVNVILKEGTVTNVTVTDMAGRNIYSTVEKSKEVRVNLSSATPGMYLVRVTVKNNKGEATITKKVNKL